MTRTYLLACMSTVPEVMICRRSSAQSAVHWALLCTVSNIPPTQHTERHDEKNQQSAAKTTTAPLHKATGHPVFSVNWLCIFPSFWVRQHRTGHSGKKKEEVWSVDTSSTSIKVSSLLFLKLHDIQFHYVTFIQLNLNRCKLRDSVSTNSVLQLLLNLSLLS